MNSIFPLLCPIRYHGRFTALAVLLFSCCSLLNAQIINVEDKRSVYGDTAAIYETLELKGDIVKNKDQIFSLVGSAQVEFSFQKRLLLSLTKVAFIKAGEQNFVNQGFQHLRYNVKWAPWLIYELFGQVQYNEQARIKLRALAGTGVRMRLFKKRKERVHLGLSFMYEYDEESSTNIVHQDPRLSTYLSLYLALGTVVEMTSTTYYQPLFEALEDYRIASESEAQFNITKKLKFTSTFAYSFDSRTPENAPNTLYSWRNGIEYHF